MRNMNHLSDQTISLNKGYELNRFSCLYQSYCLAHVYSGSWCSSVESHFMNEIFKASFVKKN